MTTLVVHDIAFVMSFRTLFHARYLANSHIFWVVTDNPGVVMIMSCHLGWHNFADYRAV